MACALAASVVAAPIDVRAAPPDGAEVAPAPENGASDDGAEDAVQADGIEAAADLYRRGEAKFAAAEYQTAIDLWTEAFAIVADSNDPRAAAILDALIYNMAKAQLFAFRLDEDPMRLKRAQASLSRHLEGLRPRVEAGEPGMDTALADGETLLDQIEQELEAFEANPDPPDPDPPDQNPPDQDPEPEPPPDHPGRGLIIGGAVTTTLGLGGLGVMSAGLAIGARAAADVDGWEDAEAREGLPADAVARGQTGNTLAIAGGVAGGVLVATGVTLLALGIAKNRSRVAAAPTLGPTFAGLAVAGRF